MTGYYARKQMGTSYQVAQRIMIVIAVALILACLQSWAHLDDEGDLAQLTPQQRAEIMRRWK
jgi:hypothetical protein